MNRLILALTCILAGSGSLFGQTGMVLSLDGTGDFVEVPDSTSLNFGANTDFTLECWFRTNDMQTANLINKSTPEGDSFDFTIGWTVDINPVNERDGTSSTGLIQRTLSTGTSRNRSSLCCFNQNLWHHIAWTAGRDTLSPGLHTISDSLYIDGVLFKA